MEPRLTDPGTIDEHLAEIYCGLKQLAGDLSPEQKKELIAVLRGRCRAAIVLLNCVRTRATGCQCPTVLQKRTCGIIGD